MFDTTFVEEPIINTTEVCDTVYVHAADVLYNIPERIRVNRSLQQHVCVGPERRFGCVDDA